MRPLIAVLLRIERVVVLSAISLLWTEPFTLFSGEAYAQSSNPTPAVDPFSHHRHRSGSLLSQAKLLIKQGRTNEAIALLRRYTAESPNDPSGSFWLGLALDEAGEPKQAIWAYSRSLDLSTKSGMDSPELRINIGNTLLKLNRPVDAIFNYKRAIEIDSKLPHAHFNLGRALLDKGENEAALGEFNRFYQLGGHDSSLPYYKAMAFRALGKSDDAKGQLELFLNTLPDTPSTQPARQRSQAILKELSQNSSTIDAPAQ